MRLCSASAKICARDSAFARGLDAWPPRGLVLGARRRGAGGWWCQPWLEPVAPACAASRGTGGSPWRGGRRCRGGPGSSRALGAAGAGDAKRLFLQLVVRVGLAGRLHGLAPFGFLSRDLAQRLCERTSRRTSTRRTGSGHASFSCFGRRAAETAITERRPGAPRTSATRAAQRRGDRLGSLYHDFQLAAAAPGAPGDGPQADRAGARVGRAACVLDRRAAVARAGRRRFRRSRPRPRPRHSLGAPAHHRPAGPSRCPTRTRSTSGCCGPRDGPPSSASG